MSLSDDELLSLDSIFSVSTGFLPGIFNQIPTLDAIKQRMFTIFDKLGF